MRAIRAYFPGQIVVTVDEDRGLQELACMRERIVVVAIRCAHRSGYKEQEKRGRA
jgi:hypothetical protein